ncbi:hypothetical protein, partial [Rosenbergiella australiborealis]
EEQPREVEIKVIPRRQPRALQQKVRVVDNAATPVVAPQTEQAVEATAPVQASPAPQASTDNNDVAPRRSRRSPRHLRVSG